MSEHKITETIRRASVQFQQNVAEYVAACSCGWKLSTIMGRGELGQHRAALTSHKAQHATEVEPTP